ncbi:MAG TPA: hypothetical protein VN455_04280, partial [Methanotrichaceae archaeon]|nr:hypothetical protein [Methanotrichaceae archaeon]
MKASRRAPIQLAFIALVAMVSAAGAVQLAATGTNTVIGNAWAEGDVFATETPFSNEDELYAGVWAHAFVPPGADGTNSASSERTVPARTEYRTFTNSEAGGHTYDLQSSYGDTTVIAKASKTGALGLAEAFSEGSSQCCVEDEAGADPAGYIEGRSQLVAFVTHTGTGTANASASGSAGHSAWISSGEFGATGSVSGSAAINAANSCGGSVTGTAWKESRSATSDYDTTSDIHEHLSLSSGRNALSALSTINGSVSGQSSGSGFYALPSKGWFGNSQSRTSGDLSSTATTYKLGDSITPGVLTSVIFVFWPGMSTKLDEVAGDATKTSLPASETLWVKNGPGTSLASSYLSSYSSASGGADQRESQTYTNAFTSAGVARTLADAREAHGASSIDSGYISATADTASSPG